MCSNGASIEKSIAKMVAKEQPRDNNLDTSLVKTAIEQNVGKVAKELEVLAQIGCNGSNLEQLVTKMAKDLEALSKMCSNSGSRGSNTIWKSMCQARDPAVV